MLDTQWRELNRLEGIQCSEIVPRLHLILPQLEVNFTLRTGLCFPFLHLRISDVLPHIVWLNNSIRDGVHWLLELGSDIWTIKLENRPSFLRRDPWRDRLLDDSALTCLGHHRLWHSPDERWPMAGFFSCSLHWKRDTLIWPEPHHCHRWYHPSARVQCC